MGEFSSFRWSVTPRLLYTQGHCKLYPSWNNCSFIAFLKRMYVYCMKIKVHYSLYSYMYWWLIDYFSFLCFFFRGRNNFFLAFWNFKIGITVIYILIMIIIIIIRINWYILFIRGCNKKKICVPYILYYYTFRIFLFIFYIKYILFVYSYLEMLHDFVRKIYLKSMKYKIRLNFNQTESSMIFNSSFFIFVQYCSSFFFI